MSDSQPTASGIVTTASGERHIPESKRADGSTRKAIKVRPGYQPPEDVAKFRVKNQQQPRPRGIPGAEGLQTTKSESLASTNKNAKRREARKKAKSTEEQREIKPSEPEPEKQSQPLDPEVEKEKKARNLRKKLKQARELRSRKEGGDALLPEQVEKVIRINQLIQQLEALGFSDDEAKPRDTNNPAPPSSIPDSGPAPA